jgi:hypothetical protein
LIQLIRTFYRLFEVLLNRNGDLFGLVSLPDFLLQVRLRDPSIGVRVALHSISIVNLSAPSNSAYRTILSVEGESTKDESKPKGEEGEANTGKEDGSRKHAIEVSYKRYDDSFKLQLTRQILRKEYFLPPPPPFARRLIPLRGFHHLIRLKVADVKLNYVSSFLRNFFIIYDGFFWEGEELTLKNPNPLPPSTFKPIKRMEVTHFLTFFFSN